MHLPSHSYRHFVLRKLSLQKLSNCFEHVDKTLSMELFFWGIQWRQRYCGSLLHWGGRCTVIWANICKPLSKYFGFLALHPCPFSLQILLSIACDIRRDWKDLKIPSERRPVTVSKQLLHQQVKDSLSDQGLCSWIIGAHFFLKPQILELRQLQTSCTRSSATKWFSLALQQSFARKSTLAAAKAIWRFETTMPTNVCWSPY